MVNTIFRRERGKYSGFFPLALLCNSYQPPVPTLIPEPSQKPVVCKPRNCSPQGIAFLRYRNRLGEGKANRFSINTEHVGGKIQI